MYIDLFMANRHLARSVDVGIFADACLAIKKVLQEPLTATARKVSVNSWCVSEPRA